ncbi:Copper binding protein, plastocyanin/azurin family (fragment) [Nitrosopumilaceae archaeon]
MRTAAAVSVAVCAAACGAALYAGWVPGSPDADVPAHDVLISLGAARPGCGGDCYDPPIIEAGAGAEVLWFNADTGFHTVTSGPYGGHDGAFDSGRIGPGGSYSALLEPGRHAYHCALHPWMHGIVVVG